MDAIAFEIAQALAPLAGVAAESIAGLLEIPPDAALGDYAFPCFILAKSLRKPPPVVAAELAAKIRPGGIIAAVATKGAYVNFRLVTSEFARRVLSRALAEEERFGASGAGQGKTLVVDFSSPNIAKPFGVGHLRSTVIGGALVRILRAAGYTVTGVNHLGDWGTQFGAMMAAWKRWGDAAALETGGVEYLNTLYVRYHEEMEKDPAAAAEAREWFRKLEGADTEARGLWEKFRAASLREFQTVYDLLGASFDSSDGESFYNDKMEAVIGELAAKGLITESEGARVVDLEAHKMPPCLLKKADGATLYATRDLAAALYRHRHYHADGLVYVVGADQRLHFRQLFKVLELAGHAFSKNCVHVDFGLVRLGGEKMSTRRGHVVLLKDLLGKAMDIVREILAPRDLPAAEKEKIARAVGIGAVVFNDLKHHRVKDIDFDWKHVLAYDPETRSFKGETGPYVQYTHTRMASVLRKYRESETGNRKPETAGPNPETADFSLLAEPAERDVIRLIHQYPLVVAKAAKHYEPSLVAGHMLALAAAFSRFWHDHRIMTDDPALTRARVALTAAGRNVLANGLVLLGVEPLETM
ncbi:MAG: arginine--tRNA ligase [Planctomycetota bacterium]